MGYANLNFPDLNGKYLDDEIKDAFLNYPLSITLITELSDKESIEKFYSLVHSAALDLMVSNNQSRILLG